jgi:hypothetical protein
MNRHPLRDLIVNDTIEYARFRRKILQDLKNKNLNRPPLEVGFERCKLSGIALEFGVWKGTALQKMVAGLEIPVYGFDSFEGLPEMWRPGYEPGAFSLNEIPDIPGATLVKGRFDETLPDFVKNVQKRKNVTFLHVDCDLYSSTKTIFDNIVLKKGAIVVFDELINYPGWENHEMRALYEFVRDTATRFEVLGMNGDPMAFEMSRVEDASNQSVAIVIT